MIKKQPFFSVKRNVVLVAIFYTFLWGCAFPLVKLCMTSFGIDDTDNMSKCLVAGIRFFLSGVLTLLWCGLKEQDGVRIEKDKIAVVLWYGILATALQYSFTYIGLSRMDGSKGAVFDQLCVFLVVLCSGFVFKHDKMTRQKVIGCVLGFIGVILINIDGVNFKFSFSGEGIMFCAVLCQTASYFVAKGSAGRMSAAKLVGYGQFVGGLLLILFALLRGGSIAQVNTLAVITLVMLALISSVAYVLSLMPLQYFLASEISSFNLLITLFGVIMSAVVLGENIFKWNYGVSLLLITLGIFFINKKR